VKLTFHYDESDVHGSEPLALRIASQDDARRWRWSSGLVLDEVARTASVETTHFSVWSMLVGWQLSPREASVGLGLSVDFEVMACAKKEDPDGELAELAYTCRPDPEFFRVEDWQVNGVDGGKVATGTIASSAPGTARYTAPNSAPATNPVNVSARAKDKNGRVILLIASVWIGSHPPLSGTITSTQVTQIGTATLTHTTSARVTFKHDIDEGLYRVNSGTVVSHIDTVDPGVCESHIAFAGAIGAQDGAIAIQEDGRYTAEAITLAPHSGTTSCTSSGAVEPVTVQQAGARWFPAPPAPNPFIPIPGSMELRARKHGVLQESLTWTPGSGGTQTTVQWQLTPDK
jgi:hypothetical protein